MKVVEVQFTPWDKVYFFDPGEMTLKKGDQVIVKTELGTELGEVVGQLEIERPEAINLTGKNIDEESGEDNTETEKSSEDNNREIKPVLRRATVPDLDKLPNLTEKRSALEYCKERKDKLELPMKFFDVHFSFDGSRITFAFVADGRVDFRELVKDLTRHFGRTIRLQQIGIRDEAKIMGDVGHCGLGLCCRGHLKELASITSEMAELQQCSHRGSERISGVCGRLLCCLNYEQPGYQELAEKMPSLGSKVIVDGKRGTVVGHHVLKQSVNVEFSSESDEGGTVVEVDLNRKKDKKKK